MRLHAVLCATRPTQANEDLAPKKTNTTVACESREKDGRMDGWTDGLTWLTKEVRRGPRHQARSPWDSVAVGWRHGHERTRLSHARRPARREAVCLCMYDNRRLIAAVKPHPGLWECWMEDGWPWTATSKQAPST